MIVLCCVYSGAGAGAGAGAAGKKGAAAAASAIPAASSRPRTDQQKKRASVEYESAGAVGRLVHDDVDVMMLMVVDVTA